MKRWIAVDFEGETDRRKVLSLQEIQLEVLKTWRVSLAYGFDGGRFGAYFEMLS